MKEAPRQPWLLVSAVPVAVGLLTVAFGVMVNMGSWRAYFVFAAALILAVIAAITTSACAAQHAAPGRRVLAFLGWLVVQLACSAGLAFALVAIMQVRYCGP